VHECLARASLRLVEVVASSRFRGIAVDNHSLDGRNGPRCPLGRAFASIPEVGLMPLRAEFAVRFLEDLLGRDPNNAFEFASSHSSNFDAIGKVPSVRTDDVIGGD
jgi:hypothetical protein